MEADLLGRTVDSQYDHHGGGVDNDKEEYYDEEKYRDVVTAEIGRAALM